MSESKVDFDDELDDEFEIEFEDDTPEEDKGKPKAPENASDEDDDLPTEDELAQYSQSSQKRIRQLTKKFHDERRAKEAIARERDQATNFAKTKLSETETLRKQLNQVASGAVNVHKEKISGEITDLKAKLAQAVDMGNGKEVAELTEKIADAKESLRVAQDAEKSIQDSSKQVDQPVDESNPANWPDSRKKWADQNKSWFGVDEEMTAVAYATHAKLVKAGVVPDTEEYYGKLTKRVKELFPDKFADKEDDSVDDVVEDEKPAPRKAAPRAAPVSNSIIKRETRNGKTVFKLSESQRALCKRLGITPQQYIAEANRVGRDDD